MKVIKFGGSSLATGEQVAKAINIITADPERRIVVLSAPGKRFKGDTKVTDLLVQLAATVQSKKDTTAIKDTIIARYQEIADYFKLTDDSVAKLRAHLTALEQASYPTTEHLYAAFMAQGENMNSRLIAHIMNEQFGPTRFVDPKELGMVVAGAPRASELVESSYASIAKFKINDGERIVVPGFFAYDKDGNLATFARGGSDITGSILARGFHVDLYENFTDVSAIYAVDPHIISHPRAINTLTYREMRELSYSGFSVFNDEAIIPVIQGGIRVNVKNTNDPTARGTFIAPTKDVRHHHSITGIAVNDGFKALYLHRYLLNKEVGLTLKILQILYKYNVSYEHMPSGIDDLTIIFAKDQINDSQVEAMTDEIKEAINPDQLEWFDNFAILMIVGEGLFMKHDLISKVLTRLADAGIAPTMINQGASRISTMIGVASESAKTAVKVIYDLSSEK
ncbi:aspartate kinase [Lacticaseibacillus hulanensis]|uniref:aspartate kinase n=1 Tax=Lacticaseibacillus hulanensis TaxID=2493111 RepID=UPI000FDA7648|nr:aspartate kinase [Lacticaseibacillus hulanensis]